MAFFSHDAALLSRLHTPHKSGALLLAPTFRAGDFDSHAVDVPFVFRGDNGFLMTYVGFDGIGYQTGLASSTDLKNWRREGCILPRGPAGSVTEFNAALTWIVRDNDLFGSGALKKFDGEYLGTYHAYPSAGYESGPAVIGLCRSRDLRHWRVEDPILFPQDGAAWENGGLYKSCLIENDGTFYLFYNAKDKSAAWREQTGFATSPDLKKWTRHAGNPVVKNGAPGAFDDRFASDPCVLRLENSASATWAMFYFGLSTRGGARDGVAFSNDLQNWRKSDEVLLDVGKSGAIDAIYAHKPSLIFDGGTLHHFYCAVAPRNAHDIANSDVQTDEMRGITVATS